MEKELERLKQAQANYYKASAELGAAKYAYKKKVTPLLVKVHPDYLNRMMKDLNVSGSQLDSDGLYIDFDGVIPFHSVPVIVDEKVTQYQFVYEGGN